MKYFLLFLSGLAWFSLRAQSDTIPPVLGCKPFVSTLIPPTGILTVQASDFIDTLYDNSPAPVAVGIRKPCTAEGFPEGQQSLTYYYIGEFRVEVWARDAAGNIAVCTAALFIGDPGNGHPFRFTVDARTPGGADIAGVLMTFQNTHCRDGFVEWSDLTGQTGPEVLYSGAGMEPGGSLMLQASKSDDPLNGVNTGDLISINQHILGIAPFQNPYQWIAADANMDGAVTGADIVFIRELILKIRRNFPGEKSWRFFPKDFVFPPLSELNGPSFCDCLLIPHLSDPQENFFEFIGVKLGDVNFSATPGQ